MTEQTQMADSWARQLGQGGTVRHPGGEPVFFFDGDFRTWGQVERRTLLNKAIAAQVARHPQR